MVSMAAENTNVASIVPGSDALHNFPALLLIASEAGNLAQKDGGVLRRKRRES